MILSLLVLPDPSKALPRFVKNDFCDMDKFINNADQCKRAVIQISTLEIEGNEYELTFKDAENVPNYPRGCYVMTGTQEKGHVFFNSNKDGKKIKEAHSICKNYGK